MIIEEDTDGYLKGIKYNFLGIICTFLLLSLFLLIVYSVLEYFYTSTDGNIYKVLLSILVFLKVFLIKIFFLEKYLLLFSYLLIILFLSLSFYFLFVHSSFFPSMILIVTSFFIYLILFNNLNFALIFFLSVVIISLLTNLLRHEIGYDNQIGFQNNDIFIELLFSWFILFFLFILFKGTMLLKYSQQRILIESNKYRYLANIEYRNRLLGRISKCILHDISTPISVVSGYLKMNNLNKSNEEKENIIFKESVLTSLLYIENVLSGSLDVVKHQCKEKIFDPDVCIINMLKILKKRLERSNINVELNLYKDTKLKGNRCSFCRIFLNLFVNSLEELELSRKAIRVIKIETYVSNNFYILNIRDNGRGFKKEILEKIQINNFILEDENLGLGLFFVFNAVKNNFKGDVSITSKRWRYTDVKIRFPL